MGNNGGLRYDLDLTSKIIMREIVSAPKELRVTNSTKITLSIHFCLNFWTHGKLFRNAHKQHNQTSVCAIIRFNVYIIEQQCFSTFNITFKLSPTFVNVHILLKKRNFEILNIKRNQKTFSHMRSTENGKLLNNLEVFSFPERKCKLLKATPHIREKC